MLAVALECQETEEREGEREKAGEREMSSHLTSAYQRILVIITIFIGFASFFYCAYFISSDFSTSPIVNNVFRFPRKAVD